MVATSVLPSPVAISAILPWCRTMPPMICTSNGTMSHGIGRPQTSIVVPHSRRQAFFTTANASHMMSSSVCPWPGAP